MPTISVYVSDQTYGSLVAAQLPLRRDTPGSVLSAIASRIFAEDRSGDRIRTILGLESA
jgi:hypothetical protein